MFKPSIHTVGVPHDDESFFAEDDIFGQNNPFAASLMPPPSVQQDQGTAVVNDAPVVLEGNSQPAQDNDDEEEEEEEDEEEDEEEEEQGNHRNNHQAWAQLDPNTNNSPLYNVVKKHKLSLIKSYLVTHPEEINCLNQYGDTVLHLSGDFNKKDIFVYLIGQGADPMIANARGRLPIRTNHPQFLCKVFRAIKLETILAKFIEYYFDTLISGIFLFPHVNQNDVEILIKYAPKKKDQIEQIISCPKNYNRTKTTLLIRLCSQATPHDAWVLKLIDWFLKNSSAVSINKRSPEDKTARDYALQNGSQAIVDMIDQRLRLINPPVNPPNPVEPVVQPVVSAPPPPAPAPAPVANPVMANPIQEVMTVESCYKQLVDQYNLVLNHVVQEFEGLEKWRAWMIQLLKAQEERLESMSALSVQMNRDPGPLLHELPKVREKIRSLQNMSVAEPVAHSAAFFPSRTGMKRTSDDMAQQDTPDKSPTASNAVL